MRELKSTEIQQVGGGMTSIPATTGIPIGGSLLSGLLIGSEGSHGLHITADAGFSAPNSISGSAITGLPSPGSTPDFPLGGS